MGWGESCFWAAFARLLVVDSVTSPILIKPATRYHFCHAGAISPVSDDAFSTPARDRFNLLCCPSSSPQLVTTFAVCRFSIMQGVSGLGIIFIAKVCLLLSIQKPDRHFKMGNSFGDAMKPGKFAGANFRRWATKLDLWLTAMDIAYVLKPVDGPLTVEKQVEFDKANVMAVGCILGVLSDNLYDVYMTHKSARDLWEAIEHKYSASDAGYEFYIMYKYHDYKMANNHSVVEQAHEIQRIVGDL
jgi:hypothetical protein